MWQACTRGYGRLDRGQCVHRKRIPDISAWPRLSCALRVLLRAKSDGLVLRFGRRAVASNETPRGIVEIDTLAAALPITDIVEQRGAGVVARYSQDEAAIGAGNSLGRHSEVVLVRRRTR